MYEVKVPLRYEYNILDKDNYGIYMKVDWLTVIFEDCTMYEVLCWINMQDSVLEFALGQYEVVRTLNTEFVFQYNGVQLYTPDLHYYLDDSKLDCKVFDIPLKKIRLDLSGSALDFLRSTGLDMNTHIFNEPQLSEAGQYHFTRIDYAYDFINYCPDFMNEFKRYIDNNIFPTGRVPCRGVNGGMLAQVKTGKEFTIYIGATGSDRLLRCYDKKLQFIDRMTGIYNKANPYNNPDSWFRIEWQCRNKFADELIFNKVDQLSVFKKLYDHYKFSEKKRTATGRAPVMFMEKLLNWDKIVLPAIRQNLHLVKIASLPERIIAWEENIALLNNTLYDELVSRKQQSKKRAQFIHNLYTLPGNERRLNMFINKINECKIDLFKPDKKLGLIEFNNRLWYVDYENGIIPDADFLREEL